MCITKILGLYEQGHGLIIKGHTVYRVSFTPCYFRSSELANGFAPS